MGLFSLWVTAEAITEEDEVVELEVATAIGLHLFTSGESVVVLRARLRSFIAAVLVPVEVRQATAEVEHHDCVRERRRVSQLARRPLCLSVSLTRTY